MAERAQVEQVAPDERKTFWWEGSFMDIPQEEFEEFVRNAPLEGLESRAASWKADEHKVPGSDREILPEQREAFSVRLAERRVILLDEIAKRAQEEMIKQSRIVGEATQEACSLRHRFGIPQGNPR